MSKHWTLIHIRNGELENPNAADNLYKSLKDGRHILQADSADKRSNPQNRYYFGIMVPMIQHGLIDLGNEYTKEEVHDFLKIEFNYSEIINHDTGEVKRVPKSTTNLSKEQFSEYIDKIQRWAAEWLGITIPDPGEQTTISYE